MDSSTPAGSKNKPRIFLAYYNKSAKPGEEPYEVAILVRNHPLETDSVNAWCFHAVNRIQSSAGGRQLEGSGVWLFEAEATRFKSTNLVGLVFLGKLPRGRTVDEVKAICANVPVAPPDDDHWRDTTWVWNALERLDEAAITVSLPCNGEELHRRGRNHILGIHRQNPTELVSVDTQMQPYNFSL